MGSIRIVYGDGKSPDPISVIVRKPRALNKPEDTEYSILTRGH